MEIDPGKEPGQTLLVPGLREEKMLELSPLELQTHL